MSFAMRLRPPESTGEHILNMFGDPVLNTVAHAIQHNDENVLDAYAETANDWDRSSQMVYGGETLLHLAVQYDRPAFISWLLAKGADPNRSNQQKVSPLHTCVTKEKYSEALRVLLSYPKIDINIRDKRGQSPLHYCVNFNSIEVAQILIGDQRTDVNSADREGKSPLHWCAIYDILVIAQKLLDSKRTNVNVQDINNQTPLHCAVCNNRYTMAKMLIDKGAGVYVRDKNGQTPLEVGNYDQLKRHIIEYIKARGIGPMRWTVPPATQLRRNES